MGGTSMRLLALSVFTMFYAAFASSIQTVPLLEEFMQASSLAADAALEVSANVLPSTFHQQRRSFSAVCPTIKSLDKDTFAAAGKSLSATAPAKCFTPSFDFLKIVCDDDCKNSKLVSGLSLPSRRLLGGKPPDANDASTLCEDKCYTKFMNAMLAMLKTTIDKDCATMIKSTKTGSKADGDGLQVPMRQKWERKVLCVFDDEAG